MNWMWIHSWVNNYPFFRCSQFGLFRDWCIPHLPVKQRFHHVAILRRNLEQRENPLLSCGWQGGKTSGCKSRVKRAWSLGEYEGRGCRLVGDGELHYLTQRLFFLSGSQSTIVKNHFCSCSQTRKVHYDVCAFSRC